MKEWGANLLHKQISAVIPHGASSPELMIVKIIRREKREKLQAGCRREPFDFPPPLLAYLLPFGQSYLPGAAGGGINRY